MSCDTCCYNVIPHNQIRFDSRGLWRWASVIAARGLGLDLGSLFQGSYLYPLRFLMICMNRVNTLENGPRLRNMLSI